MKAVPHACRLVTFRLLVALAGMAWLLGLLGAPAAAHETRPAIVTAEIDGPAVALRVSLNLEAYLAGIGPGHENTNDAPQAPVYDRLRAAAPADLAAAAGRAAIAEGLALTADGARVALRLEGVEVPQVGDLALARVSMLTLSGELPAGTRTLGWQADPLFGDTVFRVLEAGRPEPLHAAFVAAGSAAGPVAIAAAAEAAPWARLVDYVVIGFEHIVPKGLDHILFIVGLFLLSARLGPLLWQVTGFTLAHSVTLALGVLGIVSVPAAIVEPLIAASIIFIAVENLFTDRLQRWRPAVVFGFGLLHGLGFAGVLTEFGLPEGDFLPALIGFNLGVEAGQLAVLAACFLGVGIWAGHRSWYRRFITMPASCAVAVVAAFWFAERIA